MVSNNIALIDHCGRGVSFAGGSSIWVAAFVATFDSSGNAIFESSFTANRNESCFACGKASVAGAT